MTRPSIEYTPATMATISIVPITTTSTYRATLDELEAVGSTPGAALDALAARLGSVVSLPMVVSIEPVPDDSTRPDQQRLNELKQLYRRASTGQGSMSNVDRDEMERLFDAQFAASERRAEALMGKPVK